MSSVEIKPGDLVMIRQDQTVSGVWLGEVHKVDGKAVWVVLPQRVRVKKTTAYADVFDISQVQKVS